jgi:hypothetical protein
MLFFSIFFVFNVILNVVKNLKSVSLCKQILRDAQDDMGWNTPPKNFKAQIYKENQLNRNFCL